MSLPLPAEHTWGFVVGRIIHATADTKADVDRLPEAKAAKGSIRFEPRSRLSKVLTSPTAFVGYEVATATLNSLGELTDAEGQVGIWLISGVYGVSFSIEGVTIPSFEIEVTPAHTPETPLDLAIAAPYVAPTGTSVTTLLVPAGAFDGAGLGWGAEGLVWLPGAAAATASAAEALASEEGAEEASALAVASASFASSSATASASARDAAVTARQGAETAQGVAESARDSAQASASFAAGSASGAAGSASGAASSASAASASAGSAATSASAASGSATAAAGSATAASGSATAAQTAKTGAETAQTGAQTARTGAETAKTAAETAQTGAETAKTAAETARDTAIATARPAIILNEGAPIPANTPVGTLIARKSETVVATNLATNPSFEATSGTVEVWRNYLLNPTCKNSTTDWLCSAGFAMTATPTGIQVDLTGAPPAAASLLLYPQAATPTTPGVAWSASLSVTVPPGSPAATVYLRGYAYGQEAQIAGTTDTLASSAIVAPGETRLLVANNNTLTNSSVTNLRPILYIAANPAVGTRVVVSNALLVNAPTVPPYFDGSYSPDSDLTPSWTGPANASASILTGQGVPGVGLFSGRTIVSSTRWSQSGTRSLRIIPQPDGGNGAPGGISLVGLTVGQTYTISGTLRIESTTAGSALIYARRITAGVGTTEGWTAQSPPVAGVYRHTLTFTASGTGMQMRLGGDTSTVYWDDVQVVVGSADVPFFSGDTPDDAKYRYDWTGAPNVSTSTRTRIDNYIEVLETAPSTTKRLSGGFALPDHKHADLAPLVHTHTLSQITDNRELFGIGQPNGVVSAPVGTYYTDTVITAGAWRWFKASGVGNTGWVVSNGNTGRRAIAAWNSSGVMTIGTLTAPWVPRPGTAGSIVVQRINDLIIYQVINLGLSGVVGGSDIPISIPLGFSMQGPAYINQYVPRFTASHAHSPLAMNGQLCRGANFSSVAGDYITYGTIQGSAEPAYPWPTTLPGTVA